MAASSADIGYSSTFGIEGGTPGVYVLVAEVVSITPPGVSRDAIDATHLKSDDGYKEFIAGMAEGGDAKITLNFVPSATDALVTAFEAGSGNFQIIFPNGVEFSFGGIVTNYQIGDLSADKMTAEMTVKQSGKATLEAGS